MKLYYENLFVALHFLTLPYLLRNLFKQSSDKTNITTRRNDQFFFTSDFMNSRNDSTSGPRHGPFCITTQIELT